MNEWSVFLRSKTRSPLKDAIYNFNVSSLKSIS